MTKMFKTVTRTWNPFVGCRFDCTYCWARRLVETKLKDSPRYRYGFAPQFIEKELAKTFKPGEFVFVSSMGDIAWCEIDNVKKILDRIDQFPQTSFLLQSKYPRDFEKWGLPIPPNVYLGTTIETNREHIFSKAPPPFGRYADLRHIAHPHKFISIEPIMDFDLGVMLRWISDIRPEIVEVGADNYGHNLPEPSWDKVDKLLTRLRQTVPKVEMKEGLERLRHGAGIGGANE